MAHETLRRGLVLFAVAIMIVAAVTGGSTATTPTVDTSTTDGTTTTSQITNSTVFNDVDGTNDTRTYTIQANITSGEDVDMFVEANASGLRVHENDSATNVSSTDGGGVNWNLSFTGSDIDDLERSLDANVTTDVVIHDADNESNDTVATVHLNFTDGRVVENFDDVDADEDTDDAPITVEDSPENDILDTRIEIFGISSDSFTELDDLEDREIDGENSEYVLVFSNSSVADHAADAVASDAEDGDALYGMPIVLQGDETTMPVRVYYEEPPDDVDDDDDGDTYGVYHEGGVGGEDGIVFHLGESFEDDDEIKATGTLNAGRVAALTHRIQTSSAAQTVGLDTLGLSLGGAYLIAVPLLIGAPEARRRDVEDAIELEDGAESVSPGGDSSAVKAEG